MACKTRDHSRAELLVEVRKVITVISPGIEAFVSVLVV